MIIFVFALPVLAYFTQRVLLLDPRIPNDKIGRLNLFLSCSIIYIPILYLWAPSSPMFNALLALGISTLYPNMLLSKMKTDFLIEEIKDKFFMKFVGGVIIWIIVCFALIFLPKIWFLIFCGISIASFFTRMHMWIISGGSRKKYIIALLSSVLISTCYWAMVKESNLTPENWMNWSSFLSMSSKPGN